MPDPEKFAIADPDGVFLTVTRSEAEALLEDLQEDDDLSPALSALRYQLEEWLA